MTAQTETSAADDLARLRARKYELTRRRQHLNNDLLKVTTSSIMKSQFDGFNRDQICGLFDASAEVTDELAAVGAQIEALAREAEAEEQRRRAEEARRAEEQRQRDEPIRRVLREQGLLR